MRIQITYCDCSRQVFMNYFVLHSLALFYLILFPFFFPHIFSLFPPFNDGLLPGYSVISVKLAINM